MVLHVWKHEYEYTRTIPFPGITAAVGTVQRLYRIFTHGLAYTIFSLGSSILLLCIRRKLETFYCSCDEHCLKHMVAGSDSGLDPHGAVYTRMDKVPNRCHRGLPT